MLQNIRWGGAGVAILVMFNVGNYTIGKDDDLKKKHVNAIFRLISTTKRESPVHFTQGFQGNQTSPGLHAKKHTWTQETYKYLKANNNFNI